MVDEKKIKAAAKKVADSIKAWTDAQQDLIKLQVEITKAQAVLASPPNLATGGGAKVAEANIKLAKLLTKMGPAHKKLADKQKAMADAQKALTKVAPKK